jgi:hypothetical protein
LRKHFKANEFRPRPYQTNIYAVLPFFPEAFIL